MKLAGLFQHTLGQWRALRLRPTGCLDEYLYFALIFGFPPMPQRVRSLLQLQAVANASEDGTHPARQSSKESATKVTIPGLKGGQLTLHGQETSEFQGDCQTFDYFGYGERFQKLANLMEADGVTDLLLLQKGKLHPVHFETLTPASLKILRASDFLFARKVDNHTRFVGEGGMRLTEAFRSYVLVD